MPTENAARPDADLMLADFEGAPLKRLHLFAIALCACGFGVDLLELALGGAMSALFSAKPYSLDAGTLSTLVSAVYFGAVLGAPSLGWLADRIGPKRVLGGVVIWIGASSLLSFFADVPRGLAAARFVAGIGLGAYPPIMIAYLTDIAPTRRRGAVIFSACAFAYLAPPLAIFATRWLTPVAPLGVAGWRWPFLAAGLMSIAAGIGFWRAPEGPHWLAATGRLARLGRTLERFGASRSVTGRAALLPGPAGDMARGPLFEDLPGPALVIASSPLRLLVLSLVYFTIPVATVSFPLVTGPILIARHFTLSETLFYVGLATLGPVVGTLLGGFLVDRMPRRLMMAACAAGMLAAVLLFFAEGGVFATGIALIAFALFTALYMPTMTMYGAELFEPLVRGRSSAVAWVANRIAAAGAPAILLPLAHQQSSAPTVAILAGSLVFNILVIVVGAPRGRSSPT